jgi:hypothetical protein
VTACRAAISQTLTDEAEIMDSIEGVVSLTFGEIPAPGGPPAAGAGAPPA